MTKEDLESIRQVMKEELRETENSVIKQLDFVQDKLQSQIDALGKNIELMRQQVSVLKLETDNVNLFLSIVEDLKRRIEELERRTA